MNKPNVHLQAPIVRPCDARAFGEQLQDWIRRTGQSQAEFAQSLHFAPSTISGWVRGVSQPDSVNLASTLVNLRRKLPDWRVRQVLDGVVWIAMDWQSIHHLMINHLQEAERRSFCAWWEAEKPTFRRAFVPPVPAAYVPRELEGQLVDMATALSGYRQARCQAIILHGLSGTGKTTLAAGVAQHPVIATAFRDGVLWVDAARGGVEQWAERLCLALDIANQRGAWIDGWRAWAANDEHRFLLIVDDANDAGALAALLGTSSSQAVALLTTQKSDLIRAALAHWTLSSRTAEVNVPGMRPEEGRQLFELHRERPLREDECAVVQEVGRRLGWHAGGLSQVALETEADGWRAALAALYREGDFSFQTMLRRQWERVPPQHRQWMARLLGEMHGGLMFTHLYAADVWQVAEAEALERLHALQRTGMLEPFSDTPNPLGGEEMLWRALPVVWQTFGRVDVLPDHAGRLAVRWSRVQAQVRRGRLRRQMARHVVRDLGMPWWFGVWMAVWWLAWGPLKALALGVLAWSDPQDRRGRRQRLREATIVLAAERLLKKRWAQQGALLTEDLMLLYDRQDMAGLSGLGWVCAVALIGIAVDALLGRAMPGWPAGWWNGLVWLALILAYGSAIWPVAWRVWLAHRYGIETWDIALPLRLAGRVKKWFIVARKTR